MSVIRKLSLIIVGVCMMWPFSNARAAENAPAKNVYGFSFPALQAGKTIALADYKGKVLLVVNTASKCGFTGQYKGLQKLYDAYKDDGLVVIGVPSNDFGSQEPGTESEIAAFCETNYGVNFPLTAKQVVSGDAAHPFYAFARDELGFFGAPKWNFHKYLIGRDGVLVDYFNSTTAPDASSLKEAVQAEILKK